MQAKEGVLDWLNTLLTNDLTALNQYFLQAKICQHWGYGRLHSKLRELSFAEMRDAERLMEHILYLDGAINLPRLGTVQVGATAAEHLAFALQAEKVAVNTLTDAIAHCAQVGDYTTRNLLEEMVRDEADHIGWLETQLETIQQLGLANYLTQQINADA